MDEILRKYDLHFIKKEFINPVTNVRHLNNICESFENDLLAEFLFDYQKVSEIHELILSEIDEVLNGLVKEGQTGTQGGLRVFIGSDITRFLIFPGKYNDPEFTMPTIDFKEVVIRWMHFIDEN